MSYPRIYSLSTVGVLKHYIHDYLFHELRTDFVGPNGVGKSIIADLFQLLFVYDTETIRFGTDGVNKEKRSIYSLPYKTKTAYCLLNVEVSNGEFLIIGIAIPEQKGRRIIPFVIARQSDLSARRETLTLDSTQLLFANHLVVNEDIPDLTSLSRILLSQHDLYLVNFSNKEQVNDYYRFLYDKYILPLNLSSEKNFNAFSKVIQSFSKAKTLNLSSANASRNLQEFLFEESDAELINNYQQQQGALERILREYKRLSEHIEELKLKRGVLVQLWELKSQHQAQKKLYRTIHLDFTYGELKQLKRLEQEGRTALTITTNQEKQLAEKIDRLPVLEAKLKNDQAKANQNYDLHNDYARLNNDIDNLNEEINELEMLRIPPVQTDWVEQSERIDIHQLENQRIKELVQIADNYLRIYPTPNAAADKLEEQRQLLNELESKTNELLNRNKYLLSLFEDQSANSLFNWFINAPHMLSTEQRHTLLHFLSTPVNKPTAPSDGMQYLDPGQLFQDFSIENDSSINGFWLKLGAVREFIATNADVELFTDTNNWEQSIQAFNQYLQREIEIAGLKLTELKKVRELHEFDKAVLDIDLDLGLIENNQFRMLKKAVACVVQFEEKSLDLRRQLLQKSEQLAGIREQIPQSIIAEEPAVVKRELGRIRDAKSERLIKFAAYRAEKTAALRTLTMKLSTLKSDFYTISQNVISQQANLDTLIVQFHQDYNENIDTFEEPAQDPLPIKSVAEQLFEAYKNVYIGATHQFKDANSGSNTAVAIEVSTGSYSFKVLEQTLLGSQMKTHDEIESALDDANRNRLNMADNIRDNMVKVFEQTTSRYQQYKEQVRTINTFFNNRKISDRFYFRVEFTENPLVKITFIEELISKIRWSARQGELEFDKPVDQVIEDFFRKQARLKERIPIEKLLNPKSYFELSVSLTDQHGVEIPGSTGETYSAIALLGIARLSVVQKEQRPGLRFIILEEIGSLDHANFNTFPAVAKEFNYQIITMAPHTFNIGLSDEWYAHHLIKGNQDENINFYPSASYFKSKTSSDDLSIYLKGK